MSLRDILGLNKSEEEVVQKVEEVVTPTPQYATVDQMQQMVSSVMTQMQENFVNLTNGNQRQQEPVHQQQTIAEPTLDQISEAYEEGDNKKALQLQAQRELAREQRYNNQINQLRQEGQREFSGINMQLIGNTVPEYKKYEKAVQKKMDDLGLAAEWRSNPEIVKLLTNSVRGENIDAIIAEREEAKLRQLNDAAQGDLAAGGRVNPSNVQAKPVFSDDAENALRFLGKDKKEFAKSRGYKSWEDYENNAAAFQAAKRGEGNYVPKWRRNK